MYKSVIVYFGESWASGVIIIIFPTRVIARIKLQS